MRPVQVNAEALAYALAVCPQFATFSGRYAEWTDTTTPRTDKPVRFMVVRAHPVFREFSDAFRGNLPVTRIA